MAYFPRLFDQFSILMYSIMFQAFQDLLSGPVPRLEPQNTDVEPYVVDGVVYLARLSSPF